MRGAFERPLLLHVREQAHESRSFDRRFHGPLLFCGQAGALAAHYAPVRINKLLQQVNVFVVNVLYVILRKDIVGHNLYFEFTKTYNLIPIT